MWVGRQRAFIPEGVQFSATHPQEVIKVYALVARTQIAKTNRGGYQAAMKHLRRIEKVAERTECETGFGEVVAEVEWNTPAKPL